MVHVVFVYGTLRRGEANHGLLRDAVSAGDGVTVERFTLVNLGDYPAAIVASRDSQTSAIRGEIYLVEQSTFARLDQLEGYPREYDRSEFSIKLDDGRTVTAWMYFVAPEMQRLGEVIPSGDWKDRTP